MPGIVTYSDTRSISRPTLKLLMACKGSKNVFHHITRVQSDLLVNSTLKYEVCVPNLCCFYDAELDVVEVSCIEMPTPLAVGGVKVCLKRQFLFCILVVFEASHITDVSGLSAVGVQHVSFSF